MPIEIPETLSNKLKANSALYGAVLQTLSNFDPWFTQSGTPFFPEYTDHGPKHVSETMLTAASLVRDEAWAVVTPNDVGILILAVPLHDSAMHLAEDGFVLLVGPNPVDRAIPGWDETPWPELWLNFLSDASRFDARKLTSLFGDSEPVKDPKPDPKHWTLRDRLLIGEFVRRYHPRIAHETALHGVPGPGKPPLGLSAMDEDFADLAGLVARSHGMSIRAALPHLRKYDIREYKGVHAPFLMSVLRIADYLQIQSARAPKQVLMVRALRSPISEREWKSHEAIRDIRNTHEDPEAVFVDAAPKDARTFLHLRKLLASIQGELDSSWAALGEVYGRFAGLENLGLHIRRVRSNIDNVDEFAKTVPYLPYQAAFETSGSDLIKLLITPLYGEHPEVGVRELLQNAVDACRELRDYLNQKADQPAPDLVRQEGEVVITLAEDAAGARWLEVSDRGIGMTASVVREYFLKAGASFRRSDAWRRMHEDSKSKSRVLRSGRFGVGALAAFLLGNELEVSTRHVSMPEDQGLKFSAAIDTEEIEIHYCKRPVGTTIRIKITEDAVWNALYDRNLYSKPHARDWDWYCLDDPKVVRIQVSQNRISTLDQESRLSGPNVVLSAEWRRIAHPDYEDIHWSYWEEPTLGLACNGIRVRQGNRLRGELLRASGHIGLKVPSVSVFDPDGHLPLTLQRDALAANKYPFDAELFDGALRDWLASMLVLAPTRPFRGGELGAYGQWYEGIRSSHAWGSTWPNGFTPFCSTASGVTFPDAWHFHECQPHRLWFLSSDVADGEVPHKQGVANVVTVPVSDVGGVQRYREWIRVVLCGSSGCPHLDGLRVVCRRMLLPLAEYEQIRRGGIIASFLWSSVQVERSQDKFVVLNSGRCGCSQALDLLALAEGSTQEGYPVLAEWHLAKDQRSPSELSPMATLWRDLLVDPTMPYDHAERRRKHPKAFEALKEYVAAHEELAKKAAERDKQKQG